MKPGQPSRRPTVAAIRSARRLISLDARGESTSTSTSAASSPPPLGAGFRLVAVTCVLLAAVVVAAFWSGRQGEFTTWDDTTNWSGNTRIRSFSVDNVRWMFTGQLLAVWQPVSWIVAAAQYRLNGARGDVSLAHLVLHVNIALHALATVLCFFLLRQLIGLAATRWTMPAAYATDEARLASQPPNLTIPVHIGAAFGALFFGVHPLRVECVSWTSAQPYVLAILFSIATLIAYLRSRTSGSLGWLAVAVCFYALALMSKAVAVPLVAVIIILDFYPLRRWRPDVLGDSSRIIRILLEKVPFILMSGFTAWMALQAQTSKKYDPEPLLSKFLISAYCIMQYFVHTFVPLRLAPYYATPMPFSATDPWFVGGLLLVILLTLAFVLLYRRAPSLLAAWIAMIVILLPNLRFVLHGGQMAADRYTYLSCIGWAAVVGGAAAWLLAVTLRRPMAVDGARAPAPMLVPLTLVVGMMAWIGGLAAMTREYCLAYKDSTSLFIAMSDHNPRWWMGPYNLAKAHKAAGRLDLAKAALLRALSIHPPYPEANVDLGNLLASQGDTVGAIKRYETALIGKPTFHMAHWQLGMLKARQGKRDEAIRHLEIALEDAKRLRENHRISPISRDLEALKRSPQKR